MSSTLSLTMPRRTVPPPDAWVSPVSNSRIAVVALIAAETMLFTGLVGTYLVIRLAIPQWPPPGLPTLPLGITALNTFLLLASVIPMARALRAIRRDRSEAAGRLVAWAAILGLVFIAVQGFEWSRLVLHGLTLQSGSYGGAFYLLIGCHALHVFAAVAWLTMVAVWTLRGDFTAQQHDALDACALFWYFVCAVWAGLFPLVYLY